jgi:hypothetical protein
MKIYKWLLLIGLIFVVIRLNAQDSTKCNIQQDKIAIGMGMGIDYGGFGYNIIAYPYKKIGFFAGGGFALVGLSYNVGIKVRFLSSNSSSKVTPALLAMYGYNATILIRYDNKYNKLFYGYTAGFGIDIRPNPKKNNYLSVSLLIPFRRIELITYMDYLKSHSISINLGPFPILISVGARTIIK